MNIMILNGSNREAATSTRLGRYAAERIAHYGHKVQIFDLHERPLPWYTPDAAGDEDANVAELKKSMLAADAIILTTPEYHGSISGVLKNALDYLGQTYMEGKPVLSISSAGGAVGVSALLQLQAIVRNMHGINAPEWISIGGMQRRRFEEGYDEYEGGQEVEDRVHRVLSSFLALAGAVAKVH